MNTIPHPAIETLPANEPRGRPLIARILLHGAALLVGIGCYAAHEHFKLHGQSTPALLTLIAAGVLVLAPLRAVIGALFATERKLLHFAHGLGGLTIVGLTAGGAMSGGPLLDHAALAPFAIMGAAQAVMHQNHPRNAEQAAALRRFSLSLQEVQQFAGSKEPMSPENVARSIKVMRDIVAKAQALGETELNSDPGFQSALRRTSARLGLTLGLDSIDQVMGRLATEPTAAKQLPELRRELARARNTVEKS
jgi:hypothetical protein